VPTANSLLVIENKSTAIVVLFTTAMLFYITLINVADMALVALPS